MTPFCNLFTVSHFLILSSSVITWSFLGFNTISLKILFNPSYGLKGITLFGKTWKTVALRVISSKSLIATTSSLNFIGFSKCFNILTKLMSLQEYIDSLRPTCDYTCVIPCTCGGASDLRKYKTKDRAGHPKKLV